MKFAIATVFTADSNGANSLEQIYGAVDNDICYVLENNRFYRWIAASTATPSGKQVVKKREFDDAVAGRWIVEGPPGPGKIPPGFAMSLQTGLSLQLVARLAGVTTGGAPTELVSFTLPTLDGTLWTTSTTYLIANLDGNVNPAIQLRGVVSGANLAAAAIVDTSATNLDPGLPVSGWLYRLAT